MSTGGSRSTRGAVVYKSIDAATDLISRPWNVQWSGRWLRPALLFLSLLAVFKGLHRPDRWGATQMETDYSAGFIKRGLLGEILRHCHVNHYNQIVVLAFLFTVLLILELSVLAFHRITQVTGTPWTGAVMMTSFGLTYLVSLTGHLEIFQAVLAIAVLSIRRARLFLPVAIAASIAGLLVHELFLLVFVPLFALRALLDTLQPGPTSPGHRNEPATLRSPFLSGRALGLLALIVITLVTALVLSVAPTLTPPKISMLRQSMIARLDFPPREWLFAVFARGIGDNLQIMEGLARTPHYWSMQVESLFLFGPATIFFLAISLRQVRHWPEATRTLLRIAVFLASLSPLLLHSQGFDSFRFNALTALTSFLVMFIVLTHQGSQTRALQVSAFPAGWYGVAAFLVAVNMGSGIGLLDNQQVQLFPQLESLRDGLQDCLDIVHHKPLASPYEPWQEVKWDPAHPKVSDLLCLNNCSPQQTLPEQPDQPAQNKTK